MERRKFLITTGTTLAAGGMALAGCTTTAGSNVGSDPAAKRRALNTDADATLGRLYDTAHSSRQFVGRAKGVLVFPSVIAAGFWVGGQYGEGVLRVNGATTGYYSTTSASVGLQIGAQSKAIIFLFMTQSALDQFRNSNGWSAGGDASVALLKVGANGDIDTNTAQAPVEAIVLTNSGLMANLSLEGTKVSRLDL
jgi:lipid-binding SYLF domain-containing protein